jgi:ComF family protein
VRPWRGGWPDRIRRVERWLLPASCLQCHRPVHEPLDPLICGLCRSRWHPVPQPQCRRCGSPGQRPDCAVCRDWPADLASVQSAVLLDAATRPIIHHFKYGDWPRVATALSVAVIPLLARLPSAPLIPIPTTPERLRERGYNQAAELAAALASRSGRRLNRSCLRRRRHRASQTALGAAERRANLMDAFEADNAPTTLVLVDDVFTTGATLTSAARALFDADAVEIHAVTFARAEPPLAASARLLTTDCSTSERD